MKYLSAILLTFLIATGTQAAKTGIGVSVQGDGGAIYLPINISDHFRIEPSLYLHQFDTEYSNGDESTQTSASLEIGLFGKTDVLEQLSTYYGVRLGYTYSQYDRDSIFFTSQDSEIHGVSIAPTLGIEFFITERVSVGGEVALSVSYSEGDSSSSGPMMLPEKQIETSTRAQLIARFYF